MSKKDPIYLPVWPYYFLAGLAIVIAATLFLMWRPPWHPEWGDLVRLEGAVQKTEIRDYISDTSAGAVWPILTSAFFTLKGLTGEYRYPFSHPDFFMVRDNTSGFLEVWVNKADIQSGEPMIIWQIREHSDYNHIYPETFITFDEITSHLDKTGTSMSRLAARLALSGFGLVALGWLVKRWNQYRGARRWV